MFRSDALSILTIQGDTKWVGQTLKRDREKTRNNCYIEN